MTPQFTMKHYEYVDTSFASKFLLLQSVNDHKFTESQREAWSKAKINMLEAFKLEQVIYL